MQIKPTYNLVNAVGSSRIVHEADRRKNNVAKLSLAIMQAAAIFIGGAVASSQASASNTLCSQGEFDTGTGYNAQVWNPADFPNSGGSNCLTWYGDTNYSVSWNLPAAGLDILDGMGLKYVGKYPSQINPSAKAWHSHAFSASNTGRGTFQLYGRGTLTNGHTPLEWYIVDDWFGGRPGAGWAVVKTYWLDGDNYDVYRQTWASTTGFVQWWSVRRNPRKSGWMSYGAHFQQFVSSGMEAQVLKDVRFNNESNKYAGSGTLNVYSFDLKSYAP